MNIIRFTSIATALLFFTVTSVNAQNTPKKNQRKPSTAKSVDTASQPPAAALPPAPLSKPFAPIHFNSNESLLVYLANEPRKVYAWVEAQIAGVPGKPDQFTTTEERQKYDLALNEKMKAIQPIPIIGACQKKYDPDRQSFEVKVLLSSIEDLSLKSPNPEAMNLRRLSLTQTNIQRDTYSAQNGYGANVEVSRTISDDYVLAFPGGPQSEPASVLSTGNTTSSSIRLPYRYSFNFLVLSAKLPPSEARESEKQIVCMYIFSLEQPYIFKFRERESPTRDSPFEQTTNGFALFGRLDQVAVINKVSGQIYDQAARLR